MGVAGSLEIVEELIPKRQNGTRMLGSPREVLLGPQKSKQNNFSRTPREDEWATQTGPERGPFPHAAPAPAPCPSHAGKDPSGDSEQERTVKEPEREKWQFFLRD